MAKQINKELKIGTLLRGGDYKVLEVLGIGGFGITYKVEHVRLGMQLAIKEFFLSGYSVRDVDDATITLQDLDLSSYDNFKGRFAEEAKTLASLKHLNIVDVQDIFEENDTIYFVMPFVEGQTLKQLVVAHEKPTEELVGYILEIGNALAYIHGEGILHRDIKPDNIIITPEGKAILIDFGSAREFIHDKTQTHTSVLTKGYAPIEQYSSSGKKGNYSDIYSLAAVLYYVLTEQKPIDATDRMVEDLEPVSALKPDVPAHISTAIDKAMAMKPADRYQHVNDFLNDLKIAEAVPAKSQTVEKAETVAAVIPVEEPKKEAPKQKTKKEETKPVAAPPVKAKTAGPPKTENQPKPDRPAEPKVDSPKKKKPTALIGIVAVAIIAVIAVVVIKPFGGGGTTIEPGSIDSLDQSLPSSDNVVVEAQKVVYEGLDYFPELTDGKSKWYYRGAQLIADIDDVSSQVDSNEIDFGIDFNRDFRLSFRLSPKIKGGIFFADFGIGEDEYGISIHTRSVNFFNTYARGLEVEDLGETEIGDEDFYEVVLERIADTIRYVSNNRILGIDTDYSSNINSGRMNFTATASAPWAIDNFRLEGFLKEGLPPTFVPQALLTQADVVMIEEEEIAASIPQKEEEQDSEPAKEDSETMIPLGLTIDDCFTGSTTSLKIFVQNIFDEVIVPEMSSSDGQFSFEISESEMSDLMIFTVKKGDETARIGLKGNDIEGSNISLCITEHDDGIMTISNRDTEIVGSAAQEVLESQTPKTLKGKIVSSCGDYASNLEMRVLYKDSTEVTIKTDYYGNYEIENYEYAQEVYMDAQMKGKWRWGGGFEFLYGSHGGEIKKDLDQLKRFEVACTYVYKLNLLKTTWVTPQKNSCNCSFREKARTEE